jgi:hypothetical protein
LKGLLPKRGKHFDLCELFQEENGYFVSLDALAKENLNEKKHTSGRAMALLDLEAIQVACKSDVSQTYRLWELWHAGKLKVPSRKQLANVSVDAFVVGAGDHMPTICPYCHSSYSLELIDQESSEMSEGEESDYLAGLHGQVFCTVCKNEFDYGY